MADNAPTPESLLPLAPAVFHILLTLTGEERHGYSIMHEVAEMTQGQMRLGPGTLYRSLKQMLAASLITEARERPDPAIDDERRRYYRLTPFGHRVAEAEALRLSRLVVQARAKQLLPEDPAGQPGVLGGAQ